MQVVGPRDPDSNLQCNNSLRSECFFNHPQFQAQKGVSAQNGLYSCQTSFCNKFQMSHTLNVIVLEPKNKIHCFSEFKTRKYNEIQAQKDWSNIQ